MGRFTSTSMNNKTSDSTCAAGAAFASTAKSPASRKPTAKMSWDRPAADFLGRPAELDVHHVQRGMAHMGDVHRLHSRLLSGSLVAWMRGLLVDSGEMQVSSAFSGFQ